MPKWRALVIACLEEGLYREGALVSVLLEDRILSVVSLVSVSLGNRGPR